MKKIHYIPHTHWDREWYRSSEAFRIRLVYVFDKVFQLLKEEDGLDFFTFDGQVAVLEEYLAIKPEMKEQASHYIKNKRLLVGAWYTQPDLFLSSNESILRNLVIGSKIAEEYGHCMTVGWIPDAFGQIAATPQIFSELGMTSLFVWRGFDYNMIEDSVFLWQGPDQSEILTIHFPLGYGHYRYLPQEASQAVEEVITVTKQIESRFSDSELLFMGGSDHAMPQSELASIIKKINPSLKKEGYLMEQSNPEKFTDSVKKALKENGRKLETFKGEARSAVLGRIHAGISSTRIDIKNKMRKYETILPRVCEPMSVIASTLGGQYDQRVNNHFWKILFKNSFHDSIYSSSPETVNQTVENRLLNLRHGLSELVWLNFRFFKDKIDFSSLKEEEDVIMLFNTLPYARTDVAFVNLYTKNEHFSLKTMENEVIPFAKRTHLVEINTEIEDYKGLLQLNEPYLEKKGEVYHSQIVFSGHSIPPMGYQTLKICEERAVEKIETDLLATENGFENACLKVTILSDGRLLVFNKKTNETFSDLFYFEDAGDAGDEYNYSPLEKDLVITTKATNAQVELYEQNEFELVFNIKHCIEIPRCCVGAERSDQTTRLSIETKVRMLSESDTLLFETTIDNSGKDHRVRVLFSDNKTSKYNYSEGHFGPIKRLNKIEKQAEKTATEQELPIYPMNRYVYLEGRETFTILSGGPMEYEICDEDKIALTLLRSVGALGKENLAIRPGRASGYHLPTPNSQLLKKVTSTYGISFSSKRSQKSVTQAVSQLNVPIQARQLKDIVRQKNEELPANYSLLTVPNSLEMLAFKKSEDDNAYIVRLLNVAGEEVRQEKLGLHSVIKQVAVVSLKEEGAILLPVVNHCVELPKMNQNSFITLSLQL